MATVEQTISRAFQLLGVEELNETLDDAFYTDAIYALNEMLYGWSIEGFMPVSTDEITHDLVSGTNSYTIGVGATIDVTRPTEIIRAYVRDSAGYDTELDVISKGDYDRTPDKDIQGRPFDLYYDTDYEIGTLYVYPQPDQGYTVFITIPAIFSDYSVKSETVALPNEFLGPISYNLAVLLAPVFRTNVHDTVAFKARELKNNIKRLHSTKVSKMDANPIGTSRGGRSWNIQSGDYY